MVIYILYLFCYVLATLFCVYFLLFISITAPVSMTTTDADIESQPFLSPTSDSSPSSSEIPSGSNISSTNMICSRQVFRCFKALERVGDRITGAAGPYFVGLAVILKGGGTRCFCEWYRIFSIAFYCKVHYLELMGSFSRCHRSKLSITPDFNPTLSFGSNKHAYALLLRVYCYPRLRRQLGFQLTIGKRACV